MAFFFSFRRTPANITTTFGILIKPLPLGGKRSKKCMRSDYFLFRQRLSQIQTHVRLVCIHIRLGRKLANIRDVMNSRPYAVIKGNHCPDVWPD